MKKIFVVRPFIYYLNGYDRRDFEIGEHEVPYDCAAYAERSGFTRTPETKREEEPKNGDGADHPRRGKKASAG